MLPFLLAVRFAEPPDNLAARPAHQNLHQRNAPEAWPIRCSKSIEPPLPAGRKILLIDQSIKNNLTPLESSSRKI
jgi:hypothetical protein